MPSQLRRVLDRISAAAAILAFCALIVLFAIVAALA